MVVGTQTWDNKNAPCANLPPFLIPLASYGLNRNPSRPKDKKDTQLLLGSFPRTFTRLTALTTDRSIPFSPPKLVPDANRRLPSIPITLLVVVPFNVGT